MAEENITKKPKSVILEWTADRLHFIADRVFLNTGINEVSVSFWETYRSHVADLIADPKKRLSDEERKEGRIIEHDVSVDVTEPTAKKPLGSTVVKSAMAIEDLDPAEAEDLIADTWVVDTLEGWKKNSSDDTIRRACMNQIDKIMAKGQE